MSTNEKTNVPTVAELQQDAFQDMADLFNKMAKRLERAEDGLVKDMLEADIAVAFERLRTIKKLTGFSPKSGD
jgi:hypothetical protein